MICVFSCGLVHDDVIKWKHFPRYWPFVLGIYRSPVNSLHKGQWRRALMFSLICVWINGWVNNREAGDLRRYRAHYGVSVMRYYLYKSRQFLVIYNCSYTSVPVKQLRSIKFIGEKYWYTTQNDLNQFFYHINGLTLLGAKYGINHSQNASCRSLILFSIANYKRNGLMEIK